MKKILAGVAAVLALSSLSIAHAQEQEPSVQVTSKSPQRYYLTESDFHDFKGTFQLSNGQLMAFSARMNHFYTRLDDGERTRIYPVSPTKFVTQNGTVIEFSDQGETVGVSNFEKLPMAGHLPANTMVMARR